MGVARRGNTAQKESPRQVSNHSIGIIMKFMTLAAACFWTTASLAQPAPLNADGGFLASSLTGCETDLRYLNQISGWQTNWPDQWAQIRAGDGEKLDEALGRWAEADEALYRSIGLLKAGIEKKSTTPKPVVARVIDQVNGLNDALAARSVQYFFNGDLTQGKIAWNTLLEEEIAPAVNTFSKFLATEYMSAAADNVGLSAIENGEACYLGAVKWWTTLDFAPEKIEAIGRQYLEDTKNDLLRTAPEGVGYTRLMAQLREFQEINEADETEIIEITEAALRRARQKVSLAFAQPVAAPIIVEPMAVAMQNAAPAGYYRPANDTQPAAYMINPTRPKERRLMAEVIAFHEGEPGHHLAFHYPSDNENAQFVSAFAEGWAIYAEYLADELGLYGTDLDRQGMMAKHLWAASRLIIEPGLHLKGWSREQAIDFMLANTVMTRPEVEIEIDRYIAMPGQSLSYILGADVILRARAKAKKALGDTFDLKEFHDVVLRPGMRPLSNVEADIDAWIEGRRGDSLAK